MSRPVPVLLVESGSGMGGTERVLDALGRGLDREQFQPWVVLPRHAALDAWADELRRQGIPVERRAEVTSRLQWKRMLEWLGFLRRQRGAVLHVHHVWPSADRYLVPLARLAGVTAVVVTDHLAAPPHSRWQRGLKRWESRHTDAHVAVSQAVADALAADYGLSRDTVEVVVNGVPVPPAPPGEECQRWRRAWGAEDRRVWLFVGRLEAQKGADLLLEAWVSLPSPRPRLVLIGEGSERPALERRAAALGLGGDVHFAGASGEASRVLAASDAVILPSRFEGMPLVLLEALCAGVPVVATAVGGIPEATEGGRRAHLVAAPEPARLAEAVRHIEAEPEAALRAARQGAGWARARFGVERMVEEYESLYRRALRHSRSVAGAASDREVAA